MARQTNKENTKVRVVAIVRMFQQTRGTITTADILRRLRVQYGIVADRKTIYSDIAAIKGIQGKNGGYRRWDVLREAENG